MKKIQVLLIFTVICLTGKTQTILFEEDFTTGIPPTWTVVNNDGNVPNASVSEFTAAWIPFQNGSDTCAASTSFYEPVGQASDYLITPRLSIGNFSKIVWSARSFDASHPDGYVVLISNTDSLIDSFTDTLYATTAENGTWQRRSFDLDTKGYANEEVFIAFKNNTNNGYILLLDDIVLLGAEVAALNDTQNQNFKFGPNPANDFIRFDVSNLQLIEVYSLDGRKLIEATTKELAVKDLSQGHYIAVIHSSDRSTKTVRFTKE